MITQVFWSFMTAGSKDEESFPAETSLLIPKGSVISDACSLFPKGQHFCQLYKQRTVGDKEVFPDVCA